MTDESPQDVDTVALSTKVEEAFVSPLTAVRGMLEILRDYPDLDADKRQHFIKSALIECTRLERGVEDLAEAVYAAARHPTAVTEDAKTRVGVAGEFSQRIKIDKSLETFEIDLSDHVFQSSEDVNRFFDYVDQEIEKTGRQWYFLVDHTRCSIWPEAWVAFAHRGKKIAVNHAHGTIRVDAELKDADPATCRSRDEAHKLIAEMKLSARS